MTISTPSTEPAAGAFGGFTLPEVIIASALAVLVLAGVIGAFLFIGRTGFRASSYSELEAEARRGLVAFAEDVRMARDIRWHTARAITLHVPNSDGSVSTVTYGYDEDPGSTTRGCFYRQAGEADSEAPRIALVRQIADDFAFKRFKLEQPGVEENLADNDLETKQLQITFRALRSGATTVTTTHSQVSARYVLRNKRVSQ